MEVRSIFRPHFLILFQHMFRVGSGELKRAWSSVLNCETFTIVALALAGTGNKRIFLTSSIFHISYMFVLIVLNEKFLNWNLYLNFAFVWPSHIDLLSENLICWKKGILFDSVYVWILFRSYWLHKKKFCLNFLSINFVIFFNFQNFSKLFHFDEKKTYGAFYYRFWDLRWKKRFWPFFMI